MKRINKDNIANAIKRIRDANKLDQTEFGKMFNVSKSAVCQWEATGEIKIETLYDIANVFGCDISDIMNNNIQTSQKEDKEAVFREKYLVSEGKFNNLTDLKPKEIKEVFMKISNAIDSLFELAIAYKNNQTMDEEDKEFDYLLWLFNYRLGSKQEMRNQFISMCLNNDETVFDNKKRIWIRFAFEHDIRYEKFFKDEYIESTSLFVQYLSQNNKDWTLSSIVEDPLSYTGKEMKTVKLLLDNGGRILFHPKVNSETILPLYIDDLINASYSYDFNEYYKRYVNKEQWKVDEDFIVDVGATKRVRKIVELKTTDLVAYARYLLQR